MKIKEILKEFREEIGKLCAKRRNACMKEIESLIQRATRYLKSAEILLKEGDYESSVSRAYYAMFYSVQAILLTKNFSFLSHKGVISAFGEHRQDWYFTKRNGQRTQ